MGAPSLTLDERYQLFEMRLASWRMTDICRHLRRSKSCLYDELKRGSFAGDYCPMCAQQDRDRAAQRSAANHPTKPARMIAATQRRLLQDWSPEQISGRRALLGQSAFSTTGIYKLAANQGWTHLLRRTQCRQHLKRPAPHPYQGKAKSIHLRGKEVLNRIEPGHWEADTMLGKRCDKKRVIVSVERQSEYTVCRLLNQVNARLTAKLVKQDLARGTLVFKTVTTDRGVEFSAMGDVFPDQAYVCDPHQPNQRGTNENTIGLLRQYFPKGQTTARLTQAQLLKAQDKLNHRPRKSLGYRTPHEVMFNRQPTVRS